MVQVNFNEEQFSTPINSSFESVETGMIGFMLRKDIAKNRAQALQILGIVLGLCVVGSVIILYLSFTANQPPDNLPSIGPDGKLVFPAT